MNNAEAIQLLDTALDEFGRQSYADLVRRIERDPKAEPVCFEPVGASSTRYQLEIDVFWDHSPGGAVRVMGSIDDGGFWRSVAPLTRWQAINVISFVQCCPLCSAEVEA